MNVSRGADVQTAGWLVGYDQVQFTAQFASQDQLLLVATGKAAGADTRVRGAQSKTSINCLVKVSMPLKFSRPVLEKGRLSKIFKTELRFRLKLRTSPSACRSSLM